MLVLSTAGRACSASASGRGASRLAEKTRAPARGRRAAALHRGAALVRRQGRAHRSCGRRRERDAGRSAWLLQLVELQANGGRPGLFRAARARVGRSRRRAHAGHGRFGGGASPPARAVGVMADAFADEAFCRKLVAAVGASEDHWRRRAASSASMRPARSRSSPARARKACRSAGRRGRAATASSCSATGWSSSAIGACGPASTRSSRSAASSPRSRASSMPCRWPACSSTSRPTARCRTLAMLQGYVPNQGDGWASRSNTCSAISKRCAGAADDSGATCTAAYLAARRHARQAHGGAACALARERRSLGLRPGADQQRRPARRRGARARRSRDDDAPARRGRRRPARCRARRRRGRHRCPAADRGTDSPGVVGRERHRQAAHPRRLSPRPGAARAERLRDRRLRRRARPRFEARRAKHSPLRDVAGMLRSFSYAAHSALRANAVAAEETATFAPRLEEWRVQTSSAFLAGYGSAAAGGSDPQGGAPRRPARALHAREGAVRAALRVEQPARLGRHPASQGCSPERTPEDRRTP